MPTSMTECFN